MLLVLNLPLVGLWVRLLLIPRPYLYSGILIFALIGIWGVSNSWVDLLLMVVIGLMGYVMRVYDFPIAPVLIGLILGPMAETELRRALAISQGDPLALVSSPIAATMLALSAAVFVLPILFKWMRSTAGCRGAAFAAHRLALHGGAAVDGNSAPEDARFEARRAWLRSSGRPATGRAVRTISATGAPPARPGPASTFEPFGYGDRGLPASSTAIPAGATHDRTLADRRRTAARARRDGA